MLKPTRWLTITIEDRDCHSDATSFDRRTDALFHAAQLMITAREIATRHGGLATVGIIKADPGSVNTVPGRGTMSMDMRHYSDDALAHMVDELHYESKSFIEMLRTKGAHPLKIHFGRSIRTRPSISKKIGHSRF